MGREIIPIIRNKVYYPILQIILRKPKDAFMRGIAKNLKKDITSTAYQLRNLKGHIIPIRKRLRYNVLLYTVNARTIELEFWSWFNSTYGVSESKKPNKHLQHLLLSWIEDWDNSLKFETLEELFSALALSFLSIPEKEVDQGHNTQLNNILHYIRNSINKDYAQRIRRDMKKQLKVKIK